MAKLKPKKQANPAKRRAKKLSKPMPLRKRVTVPPPIADPNAARLTDEQMDLLLMLLAAGTRERALQDFWGMVYGRKLASSTLSYHRQKCREEIAARKLQRTEAALASGLALKAERVAALKEHAELLGAIRFAPSKTGRLFNEKAWRETLEDIAIEMGERKPKDAVTGEQTIKVYVGIDPKRV